MQDFKYQNWVSRITDAEPLLAGDHQSDKEPREIISGELRKIIHIDMDAFFASIEQRDKPWLRGKPVAVGGEGERSVVAAASYEARKYGVRSAMSSMMAKKKCPGLIFVKPDFEKYKAVSRQIMSIFQEYTDLVEPLSLDEAYLDVTHNKQGIPYASTVARKIREEIYVYTGLTASAGVSYCKFLAKIASDYNKPDGMKVIRPEEAATFLDTLPVERIHGVGKVTADKMNRLGIFFGRDLKRRSMEEMTAYFGKAGAYYYNIIRGFDERAVVPHHPTRSIGAERTFERDLFREEEMISALIPIAETVLRRSRDHRGRTLTLKVKHPDFRQVTRSRTLSHEVNSLGEIMSIVPELLASTEVYELGARLLGLSVSNIQEDEDISPAVKQLSLWGA